MNARKMLRRRYAKPATFEFWVNKSARGLEQTSAFDNLQKAMRDVYAQCTTGGYDDSPVGDSTHDLGDEVRR